MAWQQAASDEETLWLAFRTLAPRLGGIPRRESAPASHQQEEAAAVLASLQSIVQHLALDHWGLFRWSDLRLGFLRESGVQVSALEDIVAAAAFARWREAGEQAAFVLMDRAPFRDTPGGQQEMALFERCLGDVERSCKPLVVFGRQPLLDAGTIRKLERGPYGFHMRTRPAGSGANGSDADPPLERCLRKGAFDRLLGALGAGQARLDSFVRDTP